MNSFEIDLIKIEREARRLRAEALRSGLKAIVAFVRSGTTAFGRQTAH